jgi:enterochelin esterase-like enzyme
MWRGIFIWLALLLATPVAAQGRLDHYPAFASKFVAPRQVTVWLPEGYDPAKPLPVLYMQDGQNVFEASRAYGGHTWGVIDTLSTRIKSGDLPPVIVVGIDNGGDVRGREYLPRKIYDHMPPAARARMAQNWGGAPLSDQYLKFLVTELKPFIDKTYATQADAAHTFIMGSSMGGLISFYGQGEYPQVFGASASLSMHWVLDNPWLNTPDDAINAPQVIQAFDDYLATSRLNPTTGHVYMDQGTETLDAHYRPYSLGVAAAMKARGWQDGPHFSSQIFPGADHSETAWAKRLEIPLNFLLKQTVVASGTLITLPQVTSKFVIPRDVHVWLPDGYDPDKTYKTLYMMDGQNLFSPSQYSGADWGVAEVLPKLISEGKVPSAIIVGIDNIPERTREYMPQRVYELMAPDYQARIRAFEDGKVPNADNFLKFLVTELKPLIDKTYHTASGPENTSIMGSSMGGHIALYAQGEYPQVFGASASLSMPWLMADPAKDPAAIQADADTVAAGWTAWLKTTQMIPGRNRIYSDQGTVGLDGLFTPYEEKAVAAFRAYDWTDADFNAPVYPGAEHSEKDWRKRVDVPLLFLLNP